MSSIAVIHWHVVEVFRLLLSSNYCFGQISLFVQALPNTVLACSDSVRSNLILSDPGVFDLRQNLLIFPLAHPKFSRTVRIARLFLLLHYRLEKRVWAILHVSVADTVLRDDTALVFVVITDHIDACVVVSVRVSPDDPPVGDGTRACSWLCLGGLVVHSGLTRDVSDVFFVVFGVIKLA